MESVLECNDRDVRLQGGGLSNEIGQIDVCIAWNPGARGRGERVPGTHCMRMRLIALTFHGFSSLFHAHVSSAYVIVST